MKLRHILFSVVLGGLAVLVVYTILQNELLLNQQYSILGGYSIRLDRILILVFVTGVISSFMLYRSVRLNKNLTWSSSRHFTKSLNHLYSGKYNDALAEIQKAHDKSPSNYDILMTSGVIYKRLQDFENSFLFFSKAFEKKHTVQALLKIVDILSQVESEEKDTTVFEYIQTLKKAERITAYQAFLTYLKKEKNWELAYEVYKKAIHIDSSAFSGKDKAEILYETGRKKKSSKLMKEILKDFPSFAPAYLEYSDMLKESGQEEEMIQILKTAFSHTKLSIFLQKLEDYFLLHEMPEKAVEVLGEIVLNENHHVLARYFLGKLYYRLEMLNKAREIFKSLDGEVEFIPGLYYHLAKIYYRQDDMDTAYHYVKEMVQRSNVLTFSYHCEHCEELTDNWTERCTQCGSIGTIRMRCEEYKSDTAPVFLL